ncbi:MAG: flagellar biosynthetic protein FliO [Bryobacteraceae bacterium]
MEDIQQAIVVMAVLTMLGAALYVLRAKGMVRFAVKGIGTAGERRLQSIERLPLTAQHSLHLVRVAGRVILIAVSPGGCSVLDGGGFESIENEGRLAR